MQLSRPTLSLAASCVFFFLFLCAPPTCLAEENKALAGFDGFWEAERAAKNGGVERMVCDQRFSSAPYLESVMISEFGVIKSEWHLFFNEGCLSLKQEDDACEIRDGENVLQRMELLDKDRMRVTFPLLQIEPMDFRRIPKPPNGLWGGKDPFFATLAKSWANDDDGSLLNISIDRGDVRLQGGKREIPLPEKLFLRSILSVEDEGKVFLFFIRYPEGPVAFQLDVQHLGDRGVAKIRVHYKTLPFGDLGFFRPIR